MVCDSKKSRFIKEQEASELLNSLGIKTSLSQVPIFGTTLFWGYKMNKIINKFLFAGDTCMSEIHLRHPGFIYSAFGPFTKSKKWITKFKETGDSKYIYENKLDKTCFHHNIAYGDFKDLPKRTAFDKVLRDKALILLKLQNMMKMFW